MKQSLMNMVLELKYDGDDGSIVGVDKLLIPDNIHFLILSFFFVSASNSTSPSFKVITLTPVAVLPIALISFSENFTIHHLLHQNPHLLLKMTTRPL